MRGIAEIHRRHAAHYLHVLISLQEMLTEGSAADAIRGLDAEWEQIRLGQYRAAQNHLKLAHAYAALGMDLLERRRPAAELTGWIDVALQYTSGLDDPLVVAEQLNRRGWFRYLANDYPGACQDFEQTLELAERHAGEPESVIDDYGLITRAGYLRNLALVQHKLGDTAAAVAATEQALELLSGRGHDGEESALLGNLGVYADETGEHERAVAYYERALHIARAINDEENIANWAGNLANSLRVLGRLDEARAAARESLLLAERRGDRRLEALRLGNLASIELWSGALDSARELRRRAYAIALDIQDRRTQAVQLHGLGEIDYAARRWDGARDGFAQAHALFAEIGDRVATDRSAANLQRADMMARQADSMARQRDAEAGLARLRAGELPEGLRALTAVLDESRVADDAAAESLSLGYLAFGLQLSGRLDEALAHFIAALDLDERVGNAALFTEHLRGIGTVHHQRGDLEQALVFYRRAAQAFSGDEDLRSLGLTLANIGSACGALGDAPAAIGSYLQAVNTLFTADAPETEEVRGLLSELLAPIPPWAIEEALFEIVNRRQQIAALSVLLVDGVLLRGPDFLAVLGHRPELVFFDDNGATYDVDLTKVSGFAVVGHDGTVASFGQHPE